MVVKPKNATTDRLLEIKAIKEAGRKPAYKTKKQVLGLRSKSCRSVLDEVFNYIVLTKKESK